ncbi:hypothetical protein HA402_003352 [Bradysia odoriphaga]|nr:hypothetical protein HA402_003352 [Bradysia odoriphaga]
MPVLSSQRFSTTTGNSYLPSTYSSRLSTNSGTTSSLYSSNRQPHQFRSSLTTSSGYGSRSDDSSRFGVSRYTTRSSFDKPPTGSSATSSRFRSESRSRDYSLDGSSGSTLISGYSSSSSATKSDSNSYHNTKRQSPSSLARSVATSGADLYEKYSPSHYIPKPKLELSRSRSLSETTSSKLASADISNARSFLRSASRDRDTSSPVNSSAITSKVKKSVPSLATHNCSTFNSLHPSSNNNNLTEPPAVVTAAVTNTKSNNPKVFICSNSPPTAAVGLKNSQTKKATAVVVGKKSLVSSHNSVRNSHSNVTDSMFNNNNNNIINNNNNNSSTTITNQSKSSEFLKITGVRPLTVDRSFLRHECELARSQVVCSGLSIKSRDSSPNHSSATIVDVRPNRRPIKPLVHQTNISISLKSDTKKSDELNNNMNCLQKSPDLLDDIKYIDSDDSERKNSPTISKITTSREYFNGHMSSTLPPPTTVKIESAGINKYNTLTNPRSGHQTNGVSGTENGLSNGEKRFAFGGENGSRSTSPASRQINKRNDETPTDKQKLSGDVNGSIRNTSLRSLPPSSSSSPSSTNRYWDREGRSTLSSRTLGDSDAFNKSLASSSISDVSDDKSEGLCGLRNIGNTCFMNSVIQCLSHTSELSRFLKTKTDGRSTTKDQRILVEFAKLIRDMWTTNTRSVTPSELKSAFSCKHRMYSGCQQQDAQEFLRFFLDSLHSACNTGTKGGTLEIDDNLSDNKKADLTWEWYTKVENSMIKDLFVGQLKSSLKCTQCGNTSVTFDPFWDLSVPLPSSSKCKLESCLDLFIKEEVLDGDEMPTCSKCKTRRKSTKTFTIQRFPKYLVIHLKRFSETRWSKLSNIVEFPTGDRELNMAPYAANSSSALYSLYGISNHMGSTAGGHYVALCKHPVTKKWHEFNDNMVHDASESGLVSSSAYLLFYERA